MTHAELSAACRRPPGEPPSECMGELDVGDYGTDQSQANEGDVAIDVKVLLYRCHACNATVVVAHGADGWVLRNEYEAR